MGFRNFGLLFFLICSFSQLKAQTIGVYGSTFLSNYNDYGIYKDYKFGPGVGVFVNGFLKGQFNPGIDIQYTQDIHNMEDRRVYMNEYPFYTSGDTFFMSGIRSYRSITDIKLDLELTSPQDDTIVICFGLQPGIAYLQDHLSYNNSNLKGFAINDWVGSFGGSGTVRRNYVFGTPLQLFLSLSAQGYIGKKQEAANGINSAFYDLNSSSTSFITGYVKLGLAYKL